MKEEKGQNGEECVFYGKASVLNQEVQKDEEENI